MAFVVYIFLFMTIIALNPQKFSFDVSSDLRMPLYGCWWWRGWCGGGEGWGVGGAIMTRLTLMGCRVHLQCISWCQSEAIHVKMKRIEPIKMTSSQPLTYLPFCKLMWGCKFFTDQHFSGSSAPLLVRNSISVVCLATTQWCTRYLVSVCSLHGLFDGFRLINIKPHESLNIKP